MSSLHEHCVCLYVTVQSVIKKASVQLDNLVDAMEGEGIVVHRTLKTDFNKPIKTPGRHFVLVTAFPVRKKNKEFRRWECNSRNHAVQDVGRWKGRGQLLQYYNTYASSIFLMMARAIHVAGIGHSYVKVHSSTCWEDTALVQTWPCLFRPGSRVQKVRKYPEFSWRIVVVNLCHIHWRLA